MKIVTKDNYDRDLFKEKVVAVNVHPTYGKDMVETWNAKHHNEHSDSYLALVEDDYVPYNGYADMYGDIGLVLNGAISSGDIHTFLNTLIRDMSGRRWSIKGVADLSIQKGSALDYVVTPRGELAEKTLHYYEYQTASGTDSFYGEVIYPISKSKALVIEFEMVVSI